MRILIIEDDKGTSRFIKKGLTEKGYVADAVFDGEEGLYMATTQSYDLIVLDIMLPEMSGFEILKGMRAKGNTTPVIFLTAKHEQENIVHGLELGADDYLVKPFAFPEFLARIRAVLRRGEKTREMSQIKISDFTLNFIHRTARRAGKDIELTAKEFLLLEYLARNAGQIVTRTMILENVWGYDFDTTSNIIEVLINRLRMKIDKSFDTRLIHTIKGVGYVIKA